MCTLIIIQKMVPGIPVVLASNRDEWFSRPSSPPSFLDHSLQIVGGLDRLANGTWLGVSHGGFFAGITNQRQSSSANPELKSRGALVKDILVAGAKGGIEEAKALVAGTSFQSYNPFHIAFGNQEEIWLTEEACKGQVRRIPPGIHVLTNDGLNASSFPKVARIRDTLDPLPTQWDALREDLIALLADDTPPDDIPDDSEYEFPENVRSALHSIKVKLPHYGTCSSSIIAIGEQGLEDYFHANSPPETTNFTRQNHII